MLIQINQKFVEVPDSATVLDILKVFDARPPFAVAVNLHFVQRHQYAETRLQAGDEVEIVQPVAGG